MIRSGESCSSSLTALRSFLKAAGEGLAAAGPPALLKGEDIVVGVGALPMAPFFASRSVNFSLRSGIGVGLGGVALMS